ncbi:MAG TPA: hypothetical protein VIX84_07255 [Acidimicrobiales bacterium]
MRDAEYGASVAHGQTELIMEAPRDTPHRFFGLSPSVVSQRARCGRCLQVRLNVLRKNRLNQEVEGRIGYVKEQGDRVASHRFDLVESSRLTEDTRQLGHFDGPPPISSSTTRRVLASVAHRHHSAPSSLAKSFMIASAV